MSVEWGATVTSSSSGLLRFCSTGELGRCCFLLLRFINNSSPLVVVDFVVVVVVSCFDVWGPWSKVVGGARWTGEAAAPLLAPNCLVDKDGSVPMMVPWELG